MCKTYNSVDNPPYQVLYKCENCKKVIKVRVVYGRQAAPTINNCPKCGVGVLRIQENQENKNVGR